MPERDERRPREPGSEPLPGRVLGTGARGVRRVAELTGVDRAIEAGAEEAIVRAAESPAVERAFARILEGPMVEEAVARAIQSPAVERAIIEVLDSEMLDHVWDRLLDSDEAQRLVERIAEAPEVRAAITAQGVGLVTDLGRQVGRATRELDDIVERVVRAVLRRPARTERTQTVGLVTRIVAVAVDVAILDLGFLAVSAIVAFIDLGSLWWHRSGLRTGDCRRRVGVAAGGLGLFVHVLVVGRADAGDEVRRHPPGGGRGAGDRQAPRGPPPLRGGPLCPHPRAGIPRSPLQRPSARSP